MKQLISLLCLGMLLMALPAVAADLNGDGLEDSANIPAAPASLEVGDVAVIDTGDGSVAVFLERIGGLGYSISTIPANSNLETLLNYSVVILPVGHANATNYENFDALSNDYHMYVSSGGGLWISQPNPFQMPGNTAEITWAPYELTVEFSYNSSDCPPIVSDSSHCITQGMSATQFSFPGDTVVSSSSDWQVLVVGGATGSPGVMFAEYDGGKVLVELAHPMGGSLCPPDDTALLRYLECLAGSTVATSETDWGSLKAYFR